MLNQNNTNTIAKRATLETTKKMHQGQHNAKITAKRATLELPMKHNKINAMKKGKIRTTKTLMQHNAIKQGQNNTIVKEGKSATPSQRNAMQYKTRTKRNVNAL